MFGYYFTLALRSFRRNRVLTALMVLAIALGIGACMTTLTTFHVLSGDPIPGKSHRLYYVQLDPANMRGYNPGEEPADQSTRFDAEALLRERRADRQAMMTGGGVAVSPEREGVVPFATDARYTSADFFPMFEVPLRYGRAWTAADDDGRARGGDLQFVERARVRRRRQHRPAAAAGPGRFHGGGYHRPLLAPDAPLL